MVPGLSVTAGYYFNTGGYYNLDSNVRVQDNLSIGPEDFDAYCVAAPVDPRLPGGGGNEVCGLYDLKPEKFGQIENLVTETSNFGSDNRRNHFVNLSWDARLPNGIGFGGGIDTGRSTKDACNVVDTPEQATFTRGVGFGVDPVQFCELTMRVRGADADQDVWERPAAVWHRCERDAPEPVGPRDSGELAGDQRRCRAIVGAPAVGRGSQRLRAAAWPVGEA